MSNEIALTNRVRLTNGYANLDRNVNVTADQTGSHFSYVTQTIDSAAHELLSIAADVITPGVFFIRNLDEDGVDEYSAERYVEIGVEVSATFYPLIKLKAGECASGRLAVDEIYARTNISSVDIEFLVVED